MNKLGLRRSVFSWVSILACLVGMVGSQISATPVSPSVSPTSMTVSPDGSRRFTAAVRGTTNNAVSWKIGSGGGSISTTGLPTTFTHCRGDHPSQHGGRNKSASATVSFAEPTVLSIASCRCWTINLWERFGL